MLCLSVDRRKIISVLIIYYLSTIDYSAPLASTYAKHLLALACEDLGTIRYTGLCIEYLCILE